MHRILAIGSALGVSLVLGGCWHEAFHTSVENGTDQKAYVVIHFNDAAKPEGHGFIEPGNGVSLTESPKDISYIEYRIGNDHCRIDQKQIASIAKAGPRGVSSVTLGGCNHVAR